jgi:Undecaprenyl-phosphate glucose phosphotransferase
MAEQEFVERSENPAPVPQLDRGAAPNSHISPTVLSGIVRAGDFLIVALSAVVAAELYLRLVLSEATFPVNALFVGIAGGLIFVTIFKRRSGYSLTKLSSFGSQTRRATIALGGTSAILLATAFLLKVTATFSRGWAIVWAALAAVLFVLSRVALRAVVRQWSKRGYLTRNLAIVGAGKGAEAVIEKLRRAGDETVSIVGVFDDRRTRVPSSVAGYNVSGTTDDLVALARTNRVDDVIVTIPGHAVERLGALLHKLKRLPVDLKVSADWMVESFPIKGISSVGSVVLLDVFERPLKHWNGVLKWLEDRLLGSIILLIAAPLMAVIAAAIRLNSPGPVFFAQDRFGFNNNVIRVLKFRTMHVGSADPSGARRTVRGDPRVTAVGRILRRWSLDELPQLINVARGEMSLVGPRPHAIAMKAGGRLYDDVVSDYLHRHRVKPGVTGWAQVHGLRGEIDTLEKAHARVAHDLYYIENWSIWLDLKTLVMTMRILLSGENAY